MAERPLIIPPRVPFVDARTGTIAREWFHWLLKMVGRLDDDSVLSAFESSALEGEAQKAIRDAVVLTSFPTISHGAARQEVQDARLLQPTPHVDAELTKRVANAEVLQATLSAAAEGELRKAVADLRLLIAAVAAPQRTHSAARDMARVMLRC